MKQRNMLDLIKWKVKTFNKKMNPQQRLELTEERFNNTDESYRELLWYRDIDSETELEELVFSGDEVELFAILTGIGYGFHIKNYLN